MKVKLKTYECSCTIKDGKAVVLQKIKDITTKDLELADNRELLLKTQELGEQNRAIKDSAEIIWSEGHIFNLELTFIEE